MVRTLPQSVIGLYIPSTKPKLRPYEAVKNYGAQDMATSSSAGDQREALGCFAHSIRSAIFHC